MDITAIQKRISRLEKYTVETREMKEMIKEELENDLSYCEVVDEAKALAQKKKQLKDDLLAAGPNQKILDSIKSNTEEIKLLKEILSAELIEVYAERRTDEIADAEGESRKFKINVKILPKGVKSEGRDEFGKYSKEIES